MVMKTTPEFFPKEIPHNKFEMLIEGERIEYMGKLPDQMTRKIKVVVRTKVYAAKCNICNDENKDQINELLKAKTSFEEIEKKFFRYPIIPKFLAEHVVAGHLETDEFFGEEGWVFWYFSEHAEGGKVYVHWNEDAKSFYERK